MMDLPASGWQFSLLRTILSPTRSRWADRAESRPFGESRPGLHRPRYRGPLNCCRPAGSGRRPHGANRAIRTLRNEGVRGHDHDGRGLTSVGSDPLAAARPPRGAEGSARVAGHGPGIGVPGPDRFLVLAGGGDVLGSSLSVTPDIAQDDLD